MIARLRSILRDALAAPRLRRELADLAGMRSASERACAQTTAAAAADRIDAAEALRKLDATWASRCEALGRDLAASQDERARLAAELLSARDALATAQAECRALNGERRVLVGERDNAIAEVHATTLALRRAELAGADTKRAAKRVAR